MAKKRGILAWVAAKARLSLDQRPVAHFLRVGKTAGIAVTYALGHAPDTAKYRLVMHPHSTDLSRIPETDYYFFCVRDPIDRYVSGFLHRELQGQPRFFVPWSEAEAKAFVQFPSPDALGVSLSAGGSEQRDAEAAMRSIFHVNTSYWDWFKDPSYFKSRADRILWIGHQENLDMRTLAASLGLGDLELPQDPKRANITPRPKPHLSEVARRNLREWYAQEYQFLEICNELGFGRDQQGVYNRDRGRTFAGRIMSEPPFALHNKKAIQLAKLARRGPGVGMTRYRPVRKVLSHTAVLRNR
jgi:Sulfotransferase family